MDLRIERLLRVFRGSYERSSGSSRETEQTADFLSFIRHSGFTVDHVSRGLMTTDAIRMFKIATTITLNELRLDPIPDPSWSLDDREATIICGALPQLGTNYNHLIQSIQSRYSGFKIIIDPEELFTHCACSGRIFTGAVYNPLLQCHLTTDRNTFVLTGQRPPGQIFRLDNVTGFVTVSFPESAAQPDGNPAALPGPVPLVTPTVYINNVPAVAGDQMAFSSPLIASIPLDTTCPIFFSFDISSAYIPSIGGRNQDVQVPVKFIPDSRADGPYLGAAPRIPRNPQTPLHHAVAQAIEAFGVEYPSLITHPHSPLTITNYLEIMTLLLAM